MEIKSFSNSLSKYEKVVRKVANVYVSHLNNRSLFQMKMKELKVAILPAGKKLHHTAGFCKKEKDRIHIFLFIKEDESDDYISFVIAHEFAHLMFVKMTDVIYFSGKRPDDSTEVTAVIRVTEEGKEYGTEMEERLADIVALYVVNVLGYQSFSDILLNDLKKSQSRRRIIKELISCFGKSLMDCEKIDEFEKENHSYHISNTFWYSVVVFSLSDIIQYYEQVMGESAWYLLCDALDCHKVKGNMLFAKNEIARLHKIMSH